MDTALGTPSLLRIGALAARAGASVQAIRYYERRGLIEPVARRASGYREYLPETIDTLRFIQHAQQLGFRLTEIRDLLRLRRRVAGGNSQESDAVREAVLAKRQDLERRMRQLAAIRDTLDGLLEACDRMCSGGSRPAECPIFEAIDHADPPGSIAPTDPVHPGGGRARSAAPHPSPRGAT